MNQAFRMMVVDRDDCGRQRFAATICADPLLLLAGCHATWARALEQLPLVRPDLLLAGASLVELEAFDLVRRVKSILPSARILVSVGAGEEQSALMWLAAGAAGCVSKSCSGSALSAHLLQLRLGGYPMLPAVALVLLKQARLPDRPECRLAPGSSGITRRESHVLRLIACGCTYAQVAERLGVSLHTVATHVKNTYRKLEVHSAGAAVKRAMQLQIIKEG